MNRSWIGIRSSAVVALLGSLLTLLVAGITTLATLVGPPVPEPHYSAIPLRPLVIGTQFVLFAFAAWGISTGIAIFLRRRWSRISILVFAGLLTVMGASGLLMIPFMQMPDMPEAGVPANMGGMIRIGMAAAYGLCAAIGIWWLILFTRPGTREYYGTRDEAPADPRPLSVRIIAGYLLITGTVALPLSFFHFPMILLGVIITGWTATAIFIAVAVIQILLGCGLLRLAEWARVGTIALFSVFAVSTIVTMVHPGYDEAMKIVMREMPGFYRTTIPPAMSQPIWPIGLVGLVILAVPLYFLVRRRPAFRS
jgi:hypothetical protein